MVQTHRTMNENDEGLVADIRWETDAVCSPSEVDCRQSVECGDLNTVTLQLCDSNINRWCVLIASAFYIPIQIGHIADVWMC